MIRKKLPPQKYDLVFPSTVDRWDEAPMLGNGNTGALVWGPSHALRFSLDRSDVWDVTPAKGVHSPEFTYQNMVRLAREKNQEDLERVFDAPYNQTTPCKLPTGKLLFQFPENRTVESRLSLACAKAELRMGEIRVECFLHAEKPVGVIRVNQPMSSFSFQLIHPEYSLLADAADNLGKSDSLNSASLKQLFYPAPELHEEQELRWFTQELSADFSYGIFAMAKAFPNETLICFQVAASVDSPNWVADAKATLEEALSMGYDVLFCGHSAWWQSFWLKSALRLPDPLFEKNWYLTNYMLASCSRNGGYPMPLQGLWTADDGNLPPWKGDYHNDLNMQLSYYSYLKANHLPEGESFLDFLWGLSEEGRGFAKSFYQTEGLCMPSVMSIDGKALGGWLYSLSPANQIWLCLLFERHWRYTGDETFLKERMYPYLCQTGDCILGLLEERDGLLFLPVSSSPEIHDNNPEAFLTPNSNYDLALMRWLFLRLSQVSGQAGDGAREKWNASLLKLPPLAVTEDDVLKLSPDEALTESHRHFSHLMAIHPLRLLDFRVPREKRMMEACIEDLERLGTGGWTGYSFAWFAELFAVAKNGNGAAHQLRTFWENFCSPNGFHLNGDYKRRGSSMMHYRPFTLEGNFCAADALQEMLLYSENGCLELFPAIPEDWKNAAFSRFRAENGILVSCILKNGFVTELVLEHANGKHVQIYASPCMEALAHACGMNESNGIYALKPEKDRLCFQIRQCPK